VTRSRWRNRPETTVSSGSDRDPLSQFWSHSPASMGVQALTPQLLCHRSEHTRPNPEAIANSWKACWGQALTSSNLVSSAPRPSGQTRPPTATAVGGLVVAWSRFWSRLPLGRVLWRGRAAFARIPGPRVGGRARGGAPDGGFVLSVRRSLKRAMRRGRVGVLNQPKRPGVVARRLPARRAWWPGGNVMWEGLWASR
jgi:hypothetical protein